MDWDVRRGSRRTAGAAIPEAVRSVTLAIGLGVLLGVLSRLGDMLPGPLAWPFNMASPWLAVAFLAGSLGRKLGWGAICGTLALVAAVGAYYGYMHFVENQANASYLRHVAAPWLAVAFLGGPLFGLAGVLWRTTGAGRIRIPAVALLTGALAAESALLLLRPFDPATRAVIGLGLAAAAVLPWILLRGRREALLASALTAGFAVAGIAALTVFRAILISISG